MGSLVRKCLYTDWLWLTRISDRSISQSFLEVHRTWFQIQSFYWITVNSWSIVQCYHYHYCCGPARWGKAVSSTGTCTAFQFSIHEEESCAVQKSAQSYLLLQLRRGMSFLHTSCLSKMLYIPEITYVGEAYLWQCWKVSSAHSEIWSDIILAHIW